MKPDTLANFIIAGGTIACAAAAAYQAWQARKAADRTETKVTALLSNNVQTVQTPQINVPIHINTGAASLTGAAATTAPLSPVVKPQIEED